MAEGKNGNMHLGAPGTGAPLRVRPARGEDAPAILAVLEAAKGIMRATGNRHQWADGYPFEADILRDIGRGGGYVVEVVDEGRIAGYFAMLPSPEPTYARIEGGAWLEDASPYLVIHRIGSLPDVHGVFRALLDFALSRCPNIRIDTHRDNTVMQHLLEINGFRYCGIIYLASGDERLAYQRCPVFPPYSIKG